MVIMCKCGRINRFKIGWIDVSMASQVEQNHIAAEEITWQTCPSCSDPDVQMCTKVTCGKINRDGTWVHVTSATPEETAKISDGQVDRREYCPTCDTEARAPITGRDR